MSDWKVPITKEQIARQRDEIQIGDEIIIGWKEKSDERGNGKTKKYRGRVIEKHRHLIVCEHFKRGNRLLESVTYIQILIGDKAWLV